MDSFEDCSGKQFWDALTPGMDPSASFTSSDTGTMPTLSLWDYNLGVVFMVFSPEDCLLGHEGHTHFI